VTKAANIQALQSQRVLTAQKKEMAGDQPVGAESGIGQGEIILAKAYQSDGNFLA